MRNRWVRLVIFAAAIHGSALVAAEPGWRAGPGILHLGQIAQLRVPEGFEYVEIPLPAVPANLKEAIANRAGVIRPQNASWHIALACEYYPDPRSTQAVLRVAAWTGSAAVASRMAEFTETRQPLLSARVLEGDRFDPRTASLTMVLGFGARSRPDLILVRSRLAVFFTRQGSVTADLRARDEEFADADRQGAALLRCLQFASGQGPDWLERFPELWLEDMRESAPYAIGGLLAGMALTLIRGRRLLRPRALRPIASS